MQQLIKMAEEEKVEHVPNIDLANRLFLLTLHETDEEDIKVELLKTIKEKSELV